MEGQVTKVELRLMKKKILASEEEGEREGRKVDCQKDVREIQDGKYHTTIVC